MAISIPIQKAPTGIPGLDAILGGGLPRGHAVLVQGGPGTGKTTLAMQFLLDGVRRGERTLLVTLLQSERDLRETAASHGWDLEGIEIAALFSATQEESATARQTLLHPTEVQLNETMAAIEEALDRVTPARVVFDSIDEIRLLAQDPGTYRHRLLRLKAMLEAREVTALLTAGTEEDVEALTLVHGAVRMEKVVPNYGAARRRLLITKMRGMTFVEGYHNFRIETGGIAVYPRLLISTEPSRPDWKLVSSGIAELDSLLGGGLEEGTACMLAGQSGTGKSTVAATYACAAARRGDGAAIFLFDERIDTYLRRAQGMGVDLAPLMEAGRVRVQQVNVGEISAGELADNMRQAVEHDGARVVVLDTLTGYFNSLPEEPLLMVQMHEMLAYLGQHGVLTLLVVTEHGITGGAPESIDVSYLADAVVLLRRFEAGGMVRLAISVPKKRHGDHEKTLRELQLSSEGIRVGPPLKDFHGLLCGTPTYRGPRQRLMGQERYVA